MSIWHEVFPLGIKQMEGERTFLIWSLLRRVYMSLLHASAMSVYKHSSLFCQVWYCTLAGILLFACSRYGTALLVGKDTAPACLTATWRSLLTFPGGAARSRYSLALGAQSWPDWTEFINLHFFTPLALLLFFFFFFPAVEVCCYFIWSLQ